MQGISRFRSGKLEVGARRMMHERRWLKIIVCDVELEWLYCFDDSFHESIPTKRNAKTFYHIFVSGNADAEF